MDMPLQPIIVLTLIQIMMINITMEFIIFRTKIKFEHKLLDGLGASERMDYLETDKEIDSSRVIVWSF